MNSAIHDNDDLDMLSNFPPRSDSPTQLLRDNNEAPFATHALRQPPDNPRITDDPPLIFGINFFRSAGESQDNVGMTTAPKRSAPDRARERHRTSTAATTMAKAAAARVPVRTLTPNHTMEDEATVHHVNAAPPVLPQCTPTTRGTPTQPAVRHKECWDVKMTLPPSTQPEEDLRRVATEIFTKLQENDPHLLIYPWDEADSMGDKRLDPLTWPENIPKLLPDFKRYFPRTWPLYDGGFMYTSILVGTMTPMPKLIQSIWHWLDHKKMAILPRQLQSKVTHTIGWLAFSDNEMDCIVLAKAINAQVHFEVECRWRVISLGKKGRMKKEERVQAIHLLVDKQCRDEAEDANWELYSSEATDFSLGITMRLVPKIGNYTDPNTSAKCQEL
ncbi:hypothetical protein ACA910_022089 [Epithemia clementina (nom. ined.)]